MKRALVAAALLLLVFAKKNDRTDGLRVYGINGDSMEPTIHAKERILVDEQAYTLQPPQRGDVVAYRAPDQTNVVTIKRVVGLPFETLELRKNKLFINGKEIGDLGAHYDTTKPAEDFGPVTLKAAEYFLLGDNRGHSYDSRQHGPVLLGFIRGHVLRAAGDKGVREVR
ncbi:MAG TPA: signal peptidase I [Thermoanaerobaculia bacterium]|jgi:signal peptidase I